MFLLFLIRTTWKLRILIHTYQGYQPNISEGGIAFESKACFLSTFILILLLILALKQILSTVLSKVIRSQPIEGTDNYLYGCEFVGMAPILGYIFDEYEAEIEAGKE